MIRHCILWKFECENETDLNAKKENAKKALEALVGKIDGLESLIVITDAYNSSSADLMLDSTFKSFSAFEAYKNHPLHVEAANKYIRPFAKVRLSFDFEE